MVFRVYVTKISLLLVLILRLQTVMLIIRLITFKKYQISLINKCLFKINLKDTLARINSLPWLTLQDNILEAIRQSFCWLSVKSTIRLASALILKWVDALNQRRIVTSPMVKMTSAHQSPTISAAIFKEDTVKRLKLSVNSSMLWRTPRMDPRNKQYKKKLPAYKVGGFLRVWRMVQ